MNRQRPIIRDGHPKVRVRDRHFSRTFEVADAGEKDGLQLLEVERYVGEAVDGQNLEFQRCSLDSGRMLFGKRPRTERTAGGMSTTLGA